MGWKQQKETVPIPQVRQLAAILFVSSFLSLSPSLISLLFYSTPHTLIRYDTSIASLAYDSTGQNLAIAVSYTFEEGEKDHPADAVFIRRVTDTEVKPKMRA